MLQSFFFFFFLRFHEMKIKNQQRGTFQERKSVGDDAMGRQLWW